MLKYIKEKGYLLSCGADGEIGIWDTKNRYKNVAFYKKHDKQPVYCLEYLPEYDEIVSAGEDGVLRFWQIDGGVIKEKDTVAIANAKIYSVCYLKNESLLLVGTDRGIVYVVSLSADDKKLLLQRSNAHDGTISKMQFIDSKGKKILITGSYDGFVKVWGIKEDGTLDSLKKLGQAGSQVMGFIVVKTEGLIVSSHDDGHIRLWRGADGNDRMLLSKQDETFGQNILYFKGHHNHYQMVTGNRKMVKLWSINFENLNMR
jgi:WD40 repeat protein